MEGDETVSQRADQMNSPTTAASAEKWEQNLVSACVYIC